MYHKPFRKNLLLRLVERLFRGHPGELLPFAIVKKLEPCGEHYQGVRPIPVRRIIGSVNRHQDFDRWFRPKRQHLEARWTRIQRLWHEGYGFPAIQVYQVNDAYFVKDGNHRVSVARMEGQAFIDAEVIEVEVRRPLEQVRSKVVVPARPAPRFRPVRT